MTSTQGRRKHSACLLRLRENCPFRNLRRNKCCGPSSSSEPSGRRWRNSRDQPALPDASNCGGVIKAMYAEACPQSSSVLQPYYHSDPQVEISAPIAMDSDTAPSITAPMFSSFASGPCTGSMSSASHAVNLHQSSPSQSDASMDLDSAVDPETGERAQG